MRLRFRDYGLGFRVCTIGLSTTTTNMTSNSNPGTSILGIVIMMGVPMYGVIGELTNTPRVFVHIQPLRDLVPKISKI